MLDKIGIDDQREIDALSLMSVTLCHCVLNYTKV